MTTEHDSEALPQPTPGRPAGPRWWHLVLIGVSAVVLVLAGWFGVKAVDALFRTKASLARAVGNPLRVAVGEVTDEEISEVVGGTTLAQGLLAVSINVVVSEGRVKAVRTDLGKVVRAGDVMVEFDTDVFREAVERGRLQVEMATAELQKTRAERQTKIGELRNAVTAARERRAFWTSAAETTAKTFERTRALWEQRVVALADVEQARMKWEEAKSTLATAHLDLVRAENELQNEPVVSQALMEAAQFKVGLAQQERAQAQRNMNETVVKAPHAGVIAQRSVDPGEWVKSGKTMFTLDLLDPIYAVAQIEQEKASYVAVGREASVIFDSYPTQVHRGKIAKIDPTIDPVKRTFRVFVELANPGSQLRPGMAAFTRIENRRRVTLVPRLAVINATGAPSVDATVYVLDNDRVEARKVKLGRPEGLGRLEVLAGVKPGEWVVIHGQKDLNPGDRVTPDRVTREAPVPGPEKSAPVRLPRSG
jgi:RND family efflux transporter MFP subunit